MGHWGTAMWPSGNFLWYQTLGCYQYIPWVLWVVGWDFFFLHLFLLFYMNTKVSQQTLWWTLFHWPVSGFNVVPEHCTVQKSQATPHFFILFIQEHRPCWNCLHKIGNLAKNSFQMIYLAIFLLPACLKTASFVSRICKTWKINSFYSNKTAYLLQ